MLDLTGMSVCAIHLDQKTEYLGYNPLLMKRLLFINLLILILTANVMASAVSAACSYGTSPTTVEAENLNQYGKDQNHSASMMDSQMKPGCGSPDCNHCQCTTHLNLIVASQTPLFNAIPFHNKPYSLVSTLVKLPPHLILRPPKS